MMRLFSLLLIVFALTSCGPNVEQLPDSAGAKAKCQSLCQQKFKTDLRFVGSLTGTCYCN